MENFNDLVELFKEEKRKGILKELRQVRTTLSVASLQIKREMFDIDLNTMIMTIKVDGIMIYDDSLEDWILNNCRVIDGAYDTSEIIKIKGWSI